MKSLGWEAFDQFGLSQGLGWGTKHSLEYNLQNLRR